MLKRGEDHGALKRLPGLCDPVRNNQLRMNGKGIANVAVPPILLATPNQSISLPPKRLLPFPYLPLINPFRHPLLLRIPLLPRLVRGSNSDMQQNRPILPLHPPSQRPSHLLLGAVQASRSGRGVGGGEQRLCSVRAEPWRRIGKCLVMPRMGMKREGSVCVCVCVCARRGKALPVFLTLAPTHI
jgi:hypothetical protein